MKLKRTTEIWRDGHRFKYANGLYHIDNILPLRSMYKFFAT